METTPFSRIDKLEACVLLDCTHLKKTAEVHIPEKAGSGTYEIRWANPELFEYIIDNLWDAIDVLYLNCCPRVHDLTPLERLPNLRHLHIDWNQKALSLWNMARNPQLETLVLQAFRRLRVLDGLETAICLKALGLKGDLEKKWKIDSFAPLASLTSLENLELWEVAPLRDGFSPLHALRKLRHLNMSSNMLPVEDYARLAAALPDVTADVFAGTWSWHTHFVEGGEEKYAIELIVPVGKGKHEWRADAPGGLEKRDRYRAGFEAMVAEYRKEMNRVK